MTPKLPHALFATLWLSLLLLVLLEFYKSKSHPSHVQHAVGVGTTTGSSSFSPSASHRQSIVDRKVLASKFHFAPFRKHHRKVHVQHAVVVGTTTGSSSSSPSASHRQSIVNRKVLASKFDFAPFRKNHRKVPDDHSPHPPEPPDNGHEIDPRYGVEKRLVPTGPNPLHH